MAAGLYRGREKPTTRIHYDMNTSQSLVNIIHLVIHVCTMCMPSSGDTGIEC